jgi:polynucleotide 5'-kinase involved in rRNA processing
MWKWRKEGVKKSKEIEREIKSDKKERDKRQTEPKILILGSSDSGKSTLLKQLQIIHGNGYTQKELDKFKTRMYRNIIDIVQSIVKQANEMDAWSSEEEQAVIGTNIAIPTIIRVR